MHPSIHRFLAGLHRDESGFGLVEVLVSAVLVVLVASGVYLGLDAASATSGLNKHRTTASSIAQQDQDRMRAMTVTELSNYRDTQTSTIGAVTYTIASQASWVSDATSAADCTTNTAKTSYLRIASTVTWPNMRVAPVAVESLIAPPLGSFGETQGSLAVQVRDRNGNGVPGVSVELAGAQGYTDVTNANGCVLWGYLPVGNYTVTITKANHVDPQGVLQPSKQVGVVGEATTTLAFDYDLGGRIEGRYETLSGSTVVPADGMSFTALNANLIVPLAPFGDGQPHTSYTTGLLYPFTVAYGVYAGTCAGASPTLYGQPPQTALVTPGAAVPVSLRMPPINIQVVNGTGPNPPGVDDATVELTGTAAGCGTMPARLTDPTGFLVDRAYPYGTYTFCAHGQVGSQIRHMTVTDNSPALTTLSNTSPTGVPVASNTRIDLSNGTVGACP